MPPPPLFLETLVCPPPWNFFLKKPLVGLANKNKSILNLNFFKKIQDIGLNGKKERGHENIHVGHYQLGDPLQFKINECTYVIHMVKGHHPTYFDQSIQYSTSVLFVNHVPCSCAKPNCSKQKRTIPSNKHIDDPYRFYYISAHEPNLIASSIDTPPHTLYCNQVPDEP